MKLMVFIVAATVVVGVNSQFGGGGLGGLINTPTRVAGVAGNVPGASQLTGALKNALEGQWNNFKSLKQYADEAEKQFRKQTFLDNGAAIDLFNKGSNTFTQALNDFADLAEGEFLKLCNGFKLNLAKVASFAKGEEFKQDAAKPIPEHVDWREKGGVTPVKNQGLCASCYAFSSTGALEGQYFRKTGQLVELSPQNLMDCGKEYGNDGCDGGLIESSFEYAKKNKGVNKYTAYPYEAKGGECRYDPNSIGAECKGYGFIPKGDEKALEAAVANLGPIAVAMHVTGKNFQFYKDGVYYDPKCGNQEGDLNHAVLVVGYGKEPSGTKYWLVKNSYGEKWGNNGYFKILKDHNNHCGIATYARYPVL